MIFFFQKNYNMEETIWNKLTVFNQLCDLAYYWKMTNKGWKSAHLKVVKLANNSIYLTEILSFSLLQIVITYLSPKKLLAFILLIV